MTKLEARLIRSDMGLLQDLENKVKEFEKYLKDIRFKCNSITAQDVVDWYADNMPCAAMLNEALDKACSD